MAINMSQFYSTQEAFRSELMSGENLLWSGQPDPNVWFAKEDLFAIPFSVFWLGFALFWEWGAMTPMREMAVKTPKHVPPDAFTYFPYIFPLFGLPFVLIGLYMLFGRILVRRWKRKRTYYAVTDKRVMVLYKGRRNDLRAKNISDVEDINKSADASGRGTISFGAAGQMAYSPWASGMGASMNWGRSGNQMLSLMPLAFEDIPDAARVYELVSQKKLAEKTESFK